MQDYIRICDVEKYYGNASNMTKAVDRVSFKVNRGEFVGVMGPSGSGKTTLLNMLATIDRVTSGHIYYENTDITELSEDALSNFRKNNLGFVFQDYNLLDTLTIEENIILALTLQDKVTISNQTSADHDFPDAECGSSDPDHVPSRHGQSRKKQITRSCDEILKLLGIEDIREKFPYQVSGGQKQRCACARALVNHPKLLLADEPTGALDSKAAQTLLETFTDLNRTMKATILMVTHDAFSASYCGRILFLKDGKIFHELIRGDKNRKAFLQEILDVLSLTGGMV
ncbi:MAG: ABC transporter ATP-binding protein [Acetatifactor sp.]|nr:ABC transporter ATP-binding protein [Acetatifactor sp.]